MLIYASGNDDIDGLNNGLSPILARSRLNQYWIMVNWAAQKKKQGNFNQNTNIFIQENPFEKVVCKMPMILCQSHCVKYRSPFPCMFWVSLYKTRLKLRKINQRMYLCVSTHEVCHPSKEYGSSAQWIAVIWKVQPFQRWICCRADSRFAPSQWETSLLCNAVSHWLGANLESALCCTWKQLGTHATVHHQCTLKTSVKNVEVRIKWPTFCRWQKMHFPTWKGCLLLKCYKHLFLSV